jgi:hypothetical protein
VLICSERKVLVAGLFGDKSIAGCWLVVILHCHNSIKLLLSLKNRKKHARDFVAAWLGGRDILFLQQHMYVLY